MGQTHPLVFAKGTGYTNPAYSILSRFVLSLLGEQKSSASVSVYFHFCFTPKSKIDRIYWKFAFKNHFTLLHANFSQLMDVGRQQKKACSFVIHPFCPSFSSVSHITCTFCA